MHVEVRNFQSILHSEVTVRGLTVLVGRSNIGKSALLRAVHASLTNPLGTAFVRHGAACARLLKDQKTCKCFSSVKLTAPGYVILWEKGDAVNRYTVNTGEGEVVYDKVDRGVPPFLASLGFAPIRIGDDQVNLNVAGQWKPIFLLDRRGSEIAELVSDVGKLDRINAAIRLAEKDRREAQSVRKVREADVKQLEAKLVRYQGLDEALAHAAEVEASGEALTAEEARLARGRRHQERARALTVQLALVQAQAEVAVPDLAPLDAEAGRVQRLTGWLGRERSLSAAIARREQTARVEIPSLGALEEAFVLRTRLTGWLGTLRTLKVRLDAGKVAAQTLPPDIDALAEETARVVRLRGFAARLSTVGRQVKGAKEAVAQAELAEQASLEALAEAEKHHEAHKALAERCPTCDRPLPDQVGETDEEP